MCLLVSGTALGEAAPYTFGQEGLRVYLPEDWQVLTPDNLSDKAEKIAELGTTGEALKSSFLSSGTLLEAFPPEGGQVDLRVQKLPDAVDAASVAAMSAAQKDAFLLEMARAGGFAHGAWSPDVPGFAVFQGTSSLQELPVQTMAYATVYYGQVYMAVSQVIGREPGPSDEAALRQAAASMLFLGAKHMPEPEPTPVPRATLAPVPETSPEPAQIRVNRDATPITLDFAPATAEVPWLTLTGVTAPNVPMRYYVNSVGYERFTSDKDGRFSVNVRELPKKGKNVIKIQARSDKGYGDISFTVNLAQTPVPLAVTPVQDAVEGSALTITGSTLPGAQVEVLAKGRTYEATVEADGGFSCDVKLGQLGENGLTVEASLSGRLHGEVKLSVIRVRSQEDEQAEFLKKVKDFSYEKLLQKPENYKDKPAKYQGKVLSLVNLDGQPLAVIAADGQNPVAVLCSDLYDLEVGREATLLCTLTGSLREVELDAGLTPVPEAKLVWLVK
jgi:hypothetical protein